MSFMAGLTNKHGENKIDENDQEISEEEMAVRAATRAILAFTTDDGFLSAVAIFLKRFHGKLMAVGFTEEQATGIVSNYVNKAYPTAS